MNERYTASVVGAGVGGKLSLAGLAASHRFEPLAIADTRAEARAEIERLYPGIRCFASHGEMFAACPTDVVCVSTYAPSHSQIALEALDLPLRGMLVEKPLADTASAGRDLLACIRERGVPLAVPHGLLVARHGREIIDLVHQGAIGQLRLVEIQSNRWDILNAGIHWLNFFVVLTNNAPLELVLAQCDTSTRTYRDGLQVETLGVTYAQTTGGVRVVMETGDNVKVTRPGKECLFRLVGTAGTLEFWGWESAYHLVNGEHSVGLEVAVPRNQASNHQLHLDALAMQIDAAAPDYAIAESSLLALELCEAAYLSHRHRCTVTFPLEHFRPPAASDWDPGTPYDGVGGGRDGRRLPPA